METESKKNDRKDGKLMWELLPLIELEDVVRVYTFGAEKYGPNTWRYLPEGLQRYKAALMRHLVEFEKGQVLDDESRIPHLAHVVWNAIAMLAVSKQEQEAEIKRPEGIWHKTSELPEKGAYILMLLENGNLCSYRYEGENYSAFFKRRGVSKWAYCNEIIQEGICEE